MKTMKTIVIYHRADFDGIFCREIARRFMPGAELIGWDYGDAPPTIPDDVEALYMLDISVEALMGHPKLIWIDHHKSAMEKYGTRIGYQVDGVAACRLTWQWFTHDQSPINPHRHPANGELPQKQDFIDRTVHEPYAVRLAGEYDIWDKRDPYAELFQHGLRSQELGETIWDLLLVNSHENGGKRDVGTITVAALMDCGRAIQYAKTQENKGIIESYGFTTRWEGLCFLACNHARFNSHLFMAGIQPEHDALLGFNYDGKNCRWRFSLYHAPGKEQHDLSLIATKYGGGGHRGACGFTSLINPVI